MSRINYSIASDYTRAPGPRYEWQGKFSGESFLKEVLTALFDRAVLENLQLEINLDYTAGYGPSFLEEAFGGLARIRDKELIRRHIDFISLEEPFLIEEIREYINNAIPEEV